VSQTTRLAAAAARWNVVAPTRIVSQTSDRDFDTGAPFRFAFWYEFINRIFENETILTRLCLEASERTGRLGAHLLETVTEPGGLNVNTVGVVSV